MFKVPLYSLKHSNFSRKNWKKYFQCILLLVFWLPGYFISIFWHMTLHILLSFDYVFPLKKPQWQNFNISGFFTVTLSMKLHMDFHFILWRSTKDERRLNPWVQDSKSQICLSLLLIFVNYKEKFLHFTFVGFHTWCKLENILACIQKFLMNSYQISRNTVHYWWPKWQTKSLSPFPKRHITKRNTIVHEKYLLREYSCLFLPFFFIRSKIYDF